MDFPTTRNAICGILFRMGERGVLSNRGGRKRGSKNRNPRPVAKIYAERLQPTKGKGEAVPSFKRAPLRVASGVPEPVPLMLSMMELKRRHCRWPYGDGPFHFCGHKIEGTVGPYCSFHADAAVYTINNGVSPDTIMDEFVKRVGISGNSWKVLAA
jgi:hypothetical protein